MTTLAALLPLAALAGVVSSFITYPVAYRAGERAAANVGVIPRAPHALPAAPAPKLEAQPGAVNGLQQADRVIQTPAGQGSPRRHLGRHLGRHRAPRWTLAAWWTSIPYRDVDAPVRAELARQFAADLEIRAVMDRLAAPAGQKPAVVVLAREWDAHLAADWRERGSGPIPVIEVFDHELIGAAA